MSEKKATEEITFENALQELDNIVKSLESGNLPLEDSLKQFERGVALTKRCLAELEQAEQKVMILAKEGGEIKEKPFEGSVENE
jgi:exodeoxyribonuclease VII small subunit